MSLATIASRIDELRHERYQWRPVRRVYREKKHAMKKRPLGVPPWADKLRQDGLRLILEAYDEPQCSRYSQGVRPKRGCHTAFQESYQRGVGTKGCIEGDITAGFDSLTHPILLSILRERLHDTRFLRRSENLLRAGYLEDWPYTAPLSGSPQGAGVSPPTIWQNTAIGAWISGRWRDPKDDGYVLVVDFHTPDQGANELAAGPPIRGRQPTAHFGHEVLQLTDD